ncbi:MAG: tetratricopeptide repeat protein [Acidimicrobiia bacterium]
MTSTTIPNAVVDGGGNPISGSAEAVARYDEAVDLLLRYHPDVVTAAEGIASDPQALPMGRVFMAYLSLMSTDAPDLDGARQAAAALSTIPLNERETAHAAAIDAWLDDRWHAAARTLDELLVRWPTDVLALQVGQILDFFVGDAQNLRDRIGRSLPSFDPEDPRTGFVRGLQAFGLEESGHYDRAEAVGLAALDRNPDDVWGVHAVVHTYEMRGRIDDGIRFLRTREPDWGSGNLFTAHNWWHLALYLLEAGRYEEALSIYDAEVHNDASPEVSLVMLDASALLWRLTLDGFETGDRYATLAAAWESQMAADPWYVFNDFHAVIALCGAGRTSDARAVIERLERDVADAPVQPGSNRAMAAEVGLPASRAVVAYTEGRHADVVGQLLPIRTVFHHFGGSHAQRDVLQRTLTESAIRSGRLDLARALIDERLSLRDTSVYGLLARARVLAGQGAEAEARAAEQAAASHRSRFDAAAS